MHGLAQQAAVTLANRDLLSAWRTLDPSDARATTAALVPAVQDITAAYGDIAAVQAADFYENARASSGAPGRFRAVAAPVAPASQVRVMVRWAVTPLWSADPRTGDALTRLAGGQQRLIRKAERDTIFGSGRRDTALATWVRVPRDDACDWCLMLGSREDVYQTRETALRVSERPRGTRPPGERFHDHCRCRTVPIWSPDDIPDVNRQLHQEWQDVASSADDPIAAWKEHVSATRPNQHVARP